MANEVISLRISDEMAAQLAAATQADQGSRTAIVTKALEAYFDRKPETVRGGTYDSRLDGERLNRQQHRVAAAMVDGKWRSLREISEATGDPEASISARLRDLRKIGHTVDTMRQGDAKRGCWAYRLVLNQKRAA